MINVPMEEMNSMKIATRDKVYGYHNRLNESQFTVLPGEVFTAETELCTGSWLTSPGDTWTPDQSCAEANPTVCVAVEQAMPGDVLAVHILDIRPGPVGYTGFDMKMNPLAQRITGSDWPLTTKTVEIRDGFVLWGDGLRLPVRPMIGTLGTAPQGTPVANKAGGSHGGNMDVQEVCVGNTVYLPVFVPGALLHIGDAHAIQGDGEINCGGGVECRAEVVCRVDVLRKPQAMEWPRIENDKFIMAVACCETVEDSFYAAARELLGWMTESYGFSPREAYLLMGQVMEARCTQFVNPTRTYICSMAKRYLMQPLQ
jgi:amidase